MEQVSGLADRTDMALTALDETASQVRDAISCSSNPSKIDETVPTCCDGLCSSEAISEGS